MDALVNVLVDEVLILYCRETGDCHAVALRASSELSQSADCQSVRSRVTIRTPSDSSTLLTNPRKVVGQHGSVGTKSQFSQIQTVHTLRGTEMSPFDSTNHPEKEKSGYVQPQILVHSPKAMKTFCHIVHPKKIDKKARFFPCLLHQGMPPCVRQYAHGTEVPR